MHRYCKNCGAELHKPDSRFCPACGKSVLQQAPAVASSDSYLLVQIPGQAPFEIPLSHTRFTLGRAPDNQIVLNYPYVSLHHGHLDFDGVHWHYVDLGSTNGTYINGTSKKQSALVHGDILRIGDPQGNTVGFTFLSRIVDADVLGSGIVTIDTSKLDMTTEISIGRNPSSTLHLPGAMISWRHAVITVENHGHMLHDLSSTNGSFVNGRRIRTAHFLNKGDEIQIGPYMMVYEGTRVHQYTFSGGLRLDGISVTREVGKGKKAKRILNDITLTVYPKEFISLVGTSGAGKSTLMKALSGVSRAQSGQVLVNGDNLYEQFDLYRTMIGYVPQDDILHRDLKVGDALRYSARLRLPADTTSDEIENRIDQALEEVEMVAQKDQVINSLSGGQRKRVSIASELLAEPKLFFLDEPTSGLDPGLEKKMMFTLRRLADAGRTIILVTHATANISQCDHVCFLSQGRMAYYGPPGEAFHFFGVTGEVFSDIYDKLDDMNPDVARSQAAEWEKFYFQSVQYSKYVLNRQETQIFEAPSREEILGKRPRVNLLMQLWVLSRRYFDLVIRDRTLLAILMAVMPVTAVLIALVSKENRLIGDTAFEINRQLAAAIAAGDQMARYTIVGESQRLLFIMTLVTVLLGLFASVYEIIKEWSVYERERMLTVRILPYVISKVLVMGSFSFFQCILFLLVISFRVDFPSQGVLLPAVIEIFITIFLSTITAMMMGLFISAVVPNANTVIYLVFLSIIIQIIFSGVLYELPGPGGKLSVVTLTRCSVEAMGAIVDIDALNDLSQTRIQLDPVSEEVSTEVEKPSDDWVPVTIISATKEIQVPVLPGIEKTVPISVPKVIVNDVVTVMESVTKTFTFEPESIDISNSLEFQNNYDRSISHLVKAWSMLILLGIVFGVVTVYILRRKDVY